MDNGTVTAVSAGAATITASIEVEGVTYSDTCSITVEAAPSEWETVLDITSAEVWNDPAKWVSQEYLADTRQTYIRYNEDVEALELVTNVSAGSTTSLYLDLRPAHIDLDTNHEYRLVFEYDNTSTSNIIDISCTGAADNMLVADEWSTIAIGATMAETLTVPMLLNNASGSRLMTLQGRKAIMSNDGITPLKIKLEQKTV